MPRETEPHLRQTYTEKDIYETLPDPRTRGVCAETELIALNFLLGYGEKNLPWHPIHIDGKPVQTLRIGALPSHLIVSKEGYLIAIPQEDGSLLAKKFNVETLGNTYKTLCGLSTIPYMQAPPEIKALALSLKEKFTSLSIDPSQETLEQLFFQHLPHPQET